MSKDTIYREDAIKAIEELPNAYNGWSDAYDKAYIIGTLEEVPSAETEIEIIRAEAYVKGIDSERKRISDWCRPQGEWIIHYRDKWMVRAECPKCHRRFEFSPRAIWKCCPMCETRMKGADYEADNNKSKQ